MYTETDACPECGSDNIQAIDRVWDAETQRHEIRCICWSCNHDWYDHNDD